MKLFVGLDVSLAKTALCALTEHGKIVMEDRGVDRRDDRLGRRLIV